MPQIQDMTPHPVTVYRHGADLSPCYPLMWNVTLEYTNINMVNSGYHSDLVIVARRNFHDIKIQDEGGGGHAQRFQRYAISV